jgi:hypothetical protein
MPSVGSTAASLAVADANEDFRDWATTPPVKLLFPAIVWSEFESSSEYPDAKSNPLDRLSAVKVPVVDTLLDDEVVKPVGAETPKDR